MGLFKKEEKTEFQKLLKTAIRINERELILLIIFIYIIILEDKSEFPEKGLKFLRTLTELIIAGSNRKINSDIDRILSQVDILMTPQYSHDTSRSLSRAFVYEFSSKVKVIFFKFAVLAMRVVDGKFNYYNKVFYGMLHLHMSDPFVEKTRKQLLSNEYVESLYSEYVEFIKLINSGLKILSDNQD